MRYRREKPDRKIPRRVPHYHFEQNADRNYNVEILGDTVLQYAELPSGYYSPWYESNQHESKVGIFTVSKTVRRPKAANLTSPTARHLDHTRYIAGKTDRTIWLNLGYNYYRIQGTEAHNVYAEMSNMFLYPFPDGDNDEKLRTEAILEALTALKDQKWNAGVMIAESEGVAGMAMDALKLIASTRKAIRKGDFKLAYKRFRKKTNYMSYPQWKRQYWAQVRRDKTVRNASKIPQSWLYYHFGIKPTIDDITNAADAFALRKTDLAFGSGGIIRGYARETTKKEIVKNSYHQIQGFGGIFHYETVRSVRVVIRVRPKASFLNRLSSLGVTNPPEAIWNRIPFSWFVDYFTSFGEWLSVLDTGLGWEFADQWTESWRTIANVKFHPVSWEHINYAFGSQDSVFSRKILNRVVRKDVYGPMGSILPQFRRKGPSATRIANALSVAAQLFR